MNLFENLIDTLSSTNLHHIESSRPLDYPRPPKHDDLLFYLQRNHNKNTIIYELNRHSDCSINVDEPIIINWIRYEDGGERKKLNYLQKNLVYGYDFKQINRHCFELWFVANQDLRFFLVKENTTDQYKLYIRHKGTLVTINSIYANAHEHGAFPCLQSIEIYGNYTASRKKAFLKMSF